MRRGFTFRGVAVAAAVASVTSCGTFAPDSSDAAAHDDAAPDGFISSCNTAADCPSGTDCLYPTQGGCAAKKACLPIETHCKLLPACTCDGVNVAACEIGMTAPIKNIGMCIPDCTSGTACEACDVSGYSAPTMGTPRIATSACSQTELTSFVSACFGSTQSQTACDAWHGADAGSCATCLATALQSASQWGPFDCVSASSSCEPNAGGCVDTILGAVAQEQGQGGASSCGDLLTTTQGCIDFVCGTCAPSDMTVCAQASIAAECKTYADEATSSTGACAALVNDAGPNTSVCFPHTDADNVAFVNVFCGTGP